jgi:methylmalonyl-CoA mutase, N-terminal domain
LTAQQPDNNIVRVTVQALAAVLGGTQSLHTNSKDEALALPTEKAVEIALRTQQILAHESGVADVVDPLGGSYYIEWLTDEIERGVLAYIERIDALGGALRAVEEGFIQREIQDAAFRVQRAVEMKDQLVVGVNGFQTGDTRIEEILRVNEQVQTAQIETLAQLRSTRDNERVAAICQQIADAARIPDAPLIPLFVAAVKADVTLGEICDTLRSVFGEYMPGNWV